MGVIGQVLDFLFGGGRNVIAETAGAFVENAEAGAIRGAAGQKAALVQYAAEFTQPQKGRFDRFMDGVNRLPRPALALGTLALFVSAMVDPLWFGVRMQGLALVPEPLWWLLGAIVSFYCGARHQAKGQQFQRSIAQTMARATAVAENTRALRALSVGAPGGMTALDRPAAEGGADPALTGSGDNRALAAWRAGQGDATRRNLQGADPGPQRHANVTARRATGGASGFKPG